MINAVLTSVQQRAACGRSRKPANVRHRRGGHDVLAIDELDLRAAVAGGARPERAGKTTLLRLLAGLDLPAADTEIDGEFIADADVTSGVVPATRPSAWAVSPA